MKLENVITLNGWDDVTYYISLEDIDYTSSSIDAVGNKVTMIYTKAGNKFVTLGDAYYTLGIKKYNEEKKNES